MRELYAIYLRKSRADIELEKIEEMETLARHEKILTEVARKQGLRIGKIYKEIVSGESISERPEMIKLLKDVNERKWKGVLVVEVERLARGDTKDQGTVSESFKYSETLIVTPSKTYNPNNENDEEYFEFGLFMSRREYKTIRRRLVAGKTQSVKDGNYIASLRPFGYEMKRLNRKERILVPNEEAKHVEMIFNWFVNENLGCSKIAKKLTVLGIPTVTGKPEWNKSTINDILKNEIYIGKIRWNRRNTVKSFKDDKLIKTRPLKNDYDLIDGKHEGLISEEVFNKAQEIFKSRHNAPVRGDSQIISPVAGLVYCSQCGKAMTFKRAFKGRRARLVHPDNLKCKTKSCAFDDFLEAITYSLKMHIEDFQIKLEGNNDNSERQKQQEVIDALQNELQKLQNQRTKLFDYFERELYSEDDFLLRKRIIDEKIDLLNFSLKEELEKEVKEINYTELIINFTNVINSLKNENIPVKYKNELLKGIIERIEYTCHDLGMNKGGKLELNVTLK